MLADSPGAVVSDSLAAALVSAQAELPAVPPNATNPHFKSKFVSLDHLLAKVLPVLNRHGIAVTQWPTAGPDGQPMLATRLVHTSGEQMEAMMPLLIGKNDMQGLGGAITYARRYMLAAALGISSEEDDDGTSASSQGGVSERGASTDAPVTGAPGTGPRIRPGGKSGASLADSALISESQLTRLHTIATNRGVPKDEAKRLVKEWGGVDSSKLLPRDRYDAVCAALEAWQKPDESFADQIPVGAMGES